MNCRRRRRRRRDGDCPAPAAACRSASCGSWQALGDSASRDVGHHPEDRGSPCRRFRASRGRAGRRTSFMEHSLWVELKSRCRRGSDHASAPGGGQAAAACAPCSDKRYSEVCRANGSPERDCCLLATRPQDCSKSARLCDFTFAIRLCSGQDYLMHLTRAPSCKRRGFRARHNGEPRSSGPAWLTSQAGRDGAGTRRPCSRSAHIAPGKAPPSMSRFWPVM